MDRKTKRRYYVISAILCLCAIVIGVTYFIIYLNNKKDKPENLDDALVINQSIKDLDKFIYGFEDVVTDELNANVSVSSESELKDYSACEFVTNFVNNTYSIISTNEFLVNYCKKSNGYNQNFEFGKTYEETFENSSKTYVSLSKVEDGYDLVILFKESNSIMSYNFKILYNFEEKTLLGFTGTEFLQDSNASMFMCSFVNIDVTNYTLQYNQMFYKVGYNDFIENIDIEDYIVNNLIRFNTFSASYNTANQKIKEYKGYYVDDASILKNDSEDETILQILDKLNNSDYSSLITSNSVENTVQANFGSDISRYIKRTYHIEVVQNQDSTHSFKIYKGGIRAKDLIAQTHDILGVIDLNTCSILFGALDEFVKSNIYSENIVYFDDITYGDYIFVNPKEESSEYLSRKITSIDGTKICAVNSYNEEESIYIFAGSSNENNGEIEFVVFVYDNDVSTINTCIFENITLNELKENVSDLNNENTLADVWSDYQNYVKSSSDGCDVSKLIYDLIQLGIL